MIGQAWWSVFRPVFKEELLFLKKKKQKNFWSACAEVEGTKRAK
jgi:hypothetical protein